MAADDPVSFILAAFRGHGRSRSKVYWWMLEHYADLVLAKKSGRRVDWISVTAEMSALGFKTTTGQPLKPETVRRTWHRLEADVAAGVVIPPAGSRGQPSPKPAVSPVSAPMQPAPGPADKTPRSDDEDPPLIREPRHKFIGRPATSRFKPKTETE
jgi:hypothetical protein